MIIFSEHYEEPSEEELSNKKKHVCSHNKKQGETILLAKNLFSSQK